MLSPCASQNFNFNFNIFIVSFQDKPYKDTELTPNAIPPTTGSQSPGTPFCFMSISFPESITVGFHEL